MELNGLFRPENKEEEPRVSINLIDPHEGLSEKNP